MPAILIVDDEPAIRDSLAFSLRRDGFEVLEAASLGEARRARGRCELVLLDLMLPDGNGLDFLRELRSGSQVPVIVLTSRDSEADRVVGLELGADDYVVKPFSPREVVARVRAVLRRSQKAESGAPAALEGPGGVRVDRRGRRASVSGKELALSKVEFDLLVAFLEQPGRAFERGQLIDRIWGQDYVVGERTIDVHVKALRRKLGEAGADPEIVETVRGVGYRLREGA